MINKDTNSRHTKIQESTITRAIRGRIPAPTSLEIHPSPVCQMKCSYCHSLSSGLGKTIYNASLALFESKDYLNLFRQFSQLKGQELIISGGGEPFLHPEILSIIDQASHSTLRIHIYTNGLAEKYFTIESLNAWLPKIETIRFTYHESMNLRQVRAIQLSIDNVTRLKAKLELDLSVHVALLVDTYKDDERVRLIESLELTSIDCLELRTLVPPTPHSYKTLTVTLQYLREKNYSYDKVNLRSDTNIPIVPQKCYSLFRSATVDPYGGLRLCCMRAHYPQTDHSYVGSLREKTLLELLEAGLHNMSEAGAGNCDACSVRDSAFSMLIFEKSCT